MIKFKFLTGDCNWRQYGAKWVSQKLNNGEFDYWIVLELINWLDATGELNNGNKYVVCLSVVSPDQAGAKNLESAFSCCGIEDDENKVNDLIKVEALHSYGVHTQVWSESGNNANKLIKEAKNQSICVNGLLGFYLDKNVNRIGMTGWESLKGDLDSALKRAAFSPDPGNRLCAKISGYVAA